MSGEDGTFQKFVDRVRKVFDALEGKADIKTRLKEMLDPDNPLTSTILKEQEVSYLSDCKWASETYPRIFKSLGRASEIYAFTTISRQGEGRKDAIQLMNVTKEGGLSQYFTLRDTPEPQPKEKPK